MLFSKYSSLTILLADDHPLFRKGLKSVLRNSGFEGHFIEACDGDEVVRFHNTQSIDLFILDYRMPKLNGYSTAQIILKLQPIAKIIMMSMYDELGLISKFHDLGVAGFIDKNSEIDVIEKTIFQVLNGQESAWFAEMNTTLEEKGDCLVQFTNREKDLIGLLAKGFTSQQIAVELCLSLNTIETYRCRLLQKVDVKNTSELINFIYKNGLNSN